MHASRYSNKLNLKNHLPFIFLLILLAAFCVFYTLHAEMEFDEGYNLQIPYHLSQGEGYRTHSGKLFDAYITTGFPVLVPIAISFWGLGASLFQARLVMIIYFLLFFYGTYLLLSKLTSRTAALASLLPLLLLPNLFGYGLKVLGEVPGAVFFLFAVLLLDQRRYLLSGVLLALAGLTKLVYLIALGPVGLWFLIELIKARQTARHAQAQVIRSAASLLIGFLLPIIGWESLRFFQLGFEGYKANLLHTGHMFLRFQIDSRMGFDDILQNISMLRTPFGKLPGIVIAGLIGFSLLLPLLDFTRRYLKQPGEGASMSSRFILPALCVVFLLWWVFISDNGYWRHLFPAYLFIMPQIGYFSVSVISRAVAYLRGFNHFSLASASRAALGLVILLGTAWVYIPLIQRQSAALYHETAETILPYQEQFAGEIAKLDQAGAKFGYWDWWQAPEISFLARTHFYDISQQGHRKALNDYQEKGHPVYCIVTPVQEALDEGSVEWLFDQKMCEKQEFVDIGGFKLYPFIQ